MSSDSPSFAGARAYRERALKTLCFGVSSTPRGRQLPAPIVADRARGAHIWDTDGNRYIDYSAGYGPLILGHSPACVIDAVKEELDRGLRTASVHAGEAQLAELVCDTMPCAEKCAFVSSGSEAVHLAMRVARASTGRTQILKFRGNYHGWFDSIHAAGSVGNDGPSTLGQDLNALKSLTFVDWGDIETVRRTLTADFAAVILEPIAVNGGCFMPAPGFIEELRELTRALGVVLIFDEVITGYRLSLGGAQQVLGVTPDIAVIGKAMGGGLPIGGVVGSDAVMEPVSSGRLLHRGTFNGNPVSVGAAVGCITYLAQHADDIYPRIDAMSADLAQHIRQSAAAHGVICAVNQTGSALQIAMGIAEMPTLAEAAKADFNATRRFTGHLLERGVQVIGRGLMYLTAAHEPGDIAETKVAFDGAFAAMAKETNV